MLIHIAVTCCLAAAAFAVPQGYKTTALGGYGGGGYGGNRNSVVQGSALPRRFSVSKGSQGKGYLPPSATATARPQYQSGANGYQGSSGASQYSSGSAGYQGASASQYQGGGSQYSAGGSRYQGSSGSQYSATGGYKGSGQYGSGGGQYGSGGSQYGNGGAQYTTEDPYAEPANYDFSYEVNAPEYAVLFGHQESRRDMFARGSYKVLLPDGRTQVVEYEADQEGYRPTVTYQEAAGGYQGSGGAGGYGGYNGAGGSGGYSQGGSQGNRGYSQNGNGYASKGTSGGKASYGQKSYSGNQNYGGSAVVTGGYQVAGKGQGY